jgi:preprotein translocase subunit SecG
VKSLFNIVTFVSAIILLITILLQSQGASLSSTFGGEGSSYRSKRGAEKLIFNTTIFMVVIFVLSVVLGLLSKK